MSRQGEGERQRAGGRGSEGEGERRSAIHDEPLRVHPAVQVFRLKPDRLVVHAGGDDFIVPDLPADQQAALADLLTGTSSPRDCRRLFNDDDFDALLDALREEGIADPAEAVAAPLEGRAVAVEGDNPLARHVADLLGRSGVEVVPVTGDGPPPTCEVLVACVGWLPDRHWRVLDRACEERGLAWHRCHGDGRHLYVGPFTVPGATAGHIDTRRRQLAATDVPDLLGGLWRHLDGSGAARPYPWPDAGVLAMAAGTLVADVLAFLRDARAPGVGQQLDLDVSTRRWTVHPVLPVPRNLMTSSSDIGRSRDQTAEGGAMLVTAEPVA